MKNDRWTTRNPLVVLALTLGAPVGVAIEVLPWFLSNGTLIERFWTMLDCGFAVGLVMVVAYAALGLKITQEHHHRFMNGEID